MKRHLKANACLWAGIILTLFATACSVLPGRTAPDSEPSSGFEVSAAPAIQTAAPGTLTPAPTSIVPGPTPGLGPGSDWKTYTSEPLGIRFAYPPDWHETAPDHLEGPNGFAWIERRSDDGASPEAVCQVEANRGRPNRYGKTPIIFDYQDAEKPAGCLILSSIDQPADRNGESLYLLWLSAAEKDSELLVLHADRNHIFQIAESIEPTGETPPEDPRPESACDFQIEDMQPVHRQQDGLRIDAYPIASGDTCIPAEEAQAFNQAAGSGAAADRAAQVINWQWSAARLAALNERLSPFGYYITASDRLFTIYQGGQIVRAKLNWLGQLTIHDSGQDFILPIIDSYNGSTYLLRPDGIQTLDAWDLLLYDRVFPVYVGGDLISLAYDHQQANRPTNMPALLNVNRNGEIIDTLSVSGSTPAGGPARGLWAWENHWVLELPGLIIQDGEILNDALGYSEMFTWRLIGGKPYYFFRKDGRINAAYGGSVIPLDYDEVIYKPQFGMSILLQMQKYENGLMFYARRGDIWYYVVIEAI